VCGGVVVMTINGVVDQSDRITTEVDDALSQLDVDESAIAEVRKVIEKGASGLGTGFLSSIASGLSAVSGAVVGGFLGVLIFYYLLKDGPGLRRSLVDRASSGRGGRLDGFISETFSVLRRYWLGRSIVSAVVTAVVGVSSVVMGVPLVGTIVVVTFVGGYIPYVGAVVGGALAVIVALGSEGFTAALIMLAVVLAANLLVENMVDPIITGKTLQVHPLVVLLATTLGGTLAGIPGMIMAVPLTVIADRALPLLMRVIDTDPDGAAAQPH
jgi:predicted PurR-regulated permease PerM